VFIAECVFEGTMPECAYIVECSTKTSINKSIGTVSSSTKL